MKRYILFSTVFFTLLNSGDVFSQMKVLADGSVEVNSYVGSWGRSNQTIVYNSQACSYHLKYNNQDQFFVSAQGYLWARTGGYFGSDSVFKKNINPIQNPLKTISNLNGVSYQFKVDKEDDNSTNNPIRYGLIAQEVEKVLPEVVKTLPDNTKAIAYTDLIGILIEGIKEQQSEIDRINEKLDELTLQLKNYTSLQSTSYNSVNSINILHQNVPNPFKTGTIINYEIHEPITSDAFILILDLNGTLIKKIDIKTFGKGQVAISSEDLKHGMYLYSLFVNSKEIDTKRMILTN